MASKNSNSMTKNLAIDPSDENYMRRAITLAKQAADLGEVPVGAVLTGPTGPEPGASHEILAEAFNRRESDHSPTAHAELLAIEAAARARKSWRLTGTTLYVTLEPCLMCAGAILNARVDRVVFGAFDPKAGAAKTLYQVLEDPRLNHRCEVVGGVLEAECGALLSDFFKALRAR